MIPVNSPCYLGNDNPYNGSLSHDCCHKWDQRPSVWSLSLVARYGLGESGLSGWVNLLLVWRYPAGLIGCVCVRSMTCIHGGRVVRHSPPDCSAVWFGRSYRIPALWRKSLPVVLLGSQPIHPACCPASQHSTLKARLVSVPSADGLPVSPAPAVVNAAANCVVCYCIDGDFTTSSRCRLNAGPALRQCVWFSMDLSSFYLYTGQSSRDSMQSGNTLLWSTVDWIIPCYVKSFISCKMYSKESLPCLATHASLYRYWFCFMTVFPGSHFRQLCITFIKAIRREVSGKQRRVVSGFNNRRFVWLGTVSRKQ